MKKSHGTLAAGSIPDETKAGSDDYLNRRFIKRQRELVETDLLIVANNHWNFDVRGFNPGGNHGSFFRVSTHSTLMLAGGDKTQLPRGVLVEEPYDSLSFMPTMLALTGNLRDDRTPLPVLWNKGFRKFPGRIVKEILPAPAKSESGNYWSRCVALMVSEGELSPEWQDTDLEDLVEDPEPSGPSGSRRSFIWVQGLAFLLGIALLAYVIDRVGVQPIFDALFKIGFGFFFVLGISGLRHFLRTIAMRAAVPSEHRRISFIQAFAARLGGEAISFLTFTGPLLGEATKVALLRKRIPLTYGVPALVVDNLIYNLSVVFFVLRAPA